MKVARHIQSNRSTSIVMQNMQIFYGSAIMFFLTCFTCFLLHVVILDTKMLK